MSLSSLLTPPVLQSSDIAATEVADAADCCPRTHGVLLFVWPCLNPSECTEIDSNRAYHSASTLCCFCSSVGNCSSYDPHHHILYTDHTCSHNDLYLRTCSTLYLSQVLLAQVCHHHSLAFDPCLKI